MQKQRASTWAIGGTAAAVAVIIVTGSTVGLFGLGDDHAATEVPRAATAPSVPASAPGSAPSSAPGIAPVAPAPASIGEQLVQAQAGLGQFTTDSAPAVASRSEREHDERDEHERAERRDHSEREQRDRGRLLARLFGGDHDDHDDHD